MRRFSHTHVDSNGFTLVEMVTALFIIGILVAIVLGTGRDAVRQSRVATARADLQFAADALDRYRLVFGDYPPPATSPARPEGETADGGSFPYLPMDYTRRTLDGNDDYHFAALFPQGFTAIDPWGAPYRYQLTDSEEEGEPPVYSLRSPGPDGKEGNDDDIEYPL